MKVNEVSVWTATPGAVPADAWPGLDAMLDGEERERCARFRFEADRRAYVLSHALRRAVLAQEVGVAADALRFADDSKGKPELVWPVARSLFFSHSHSRAAVALAVSHDAPVGIDVEAADPRRAEPGVLNRYIDAALGVDFFVQWTALEAFWKAMGDGLGADQPRMHLRAIGGRIHEASIPGHRAHVLMIPGVANCTVAVAVRNIQAHAFVPPRLKLVHCDSPFGFSRLFHAARPHEIEEPT